MIALDIARWCDKFWFVLWPLGVGACFLVTFGIASFVGKGAGEPPHRPLGTG
jgi:hypothetical protein